MLLALESVFVVLLAWLVLAQRPQRAETYALGLGVLGAVFVASGESGGTSSGLGAAFMVLSAVIAAGYAIVSRQVVGGHDPIALVARQGMASLLVTAPFVLGSWACLAAGPRGVAHDPRARGSHRLLGSPCRSRCGRWRSRTSEPASPPCR